MLQSFTSAHTARFGSGVVILRSNTALDDDQLQHAATSVFAQGKHGSRSDKYTYIPRMKPGRDRFLQDHRWPISSPAPPSAATRPISRCRRRTAKPKAARNETGTQRNGTVIAAKPHPVSGYVPLHVNN